jgi:hypothetical protein
LRRGTRFLLRTAVQVSIDDVVIEEHTEYISTQGLRIELDKFFHQTDKAKITLRFPQLQSVTSKFELSNLPYIVRHVSKDQHVVHLQSFVTEKSNTARRFFENLIKSNHSKLRACRDEEEVPNIGEALRNIYAQNIINVAYFLCKDSVDFVPDAVSTSSGTNRLMQQLHFQAKPGQLNLYPLYRNAKMRHDFINHTLANMKPNERTEMLGIIDCLRPK